MSKTSAIQETVST